MDNNNQTGNLNELVGKMRGMANYISSLWFELRKFSNSLEGLTQTLNEIAEQLEQMQIQKESNNE